MDDGYLIIWYDKDEEVKGTMEVLYKDEDVFEILQKEGEKTQKDRRNFAIYKLGKCIIDWS